MIGTESKPLITALQNSAFIGSMLVQPSAAPTSVDAVMIP